MEIKTKYSLDDEVYTFGMLNAKKFPKPLVIREVFTQTSETGTEIKYRTFCSPALYEETDLILPEKAKKIWRIWHE